jgi:uncharacterized protein
MPSVRLPGATALLSSVCAQTRVNASHFAPGTAALSAPGNSVLSNKPRGLCRPASSTSPSMTLGKVIVAGGTGFVGTRLIRELVKQGADVTVLTRSKSSADHLPAGVTVQTWAPEPLNGIGEDWIGWQEVLKNAEAVISLAGSPVISRWTEAGKRAIKESRTKSTTALADAITKLPVDQRPKTVVSTSAVGYYGVSDDAQFTELASPARNDFLADVAIAWEKAAQPIADAGVRLSIMRVGVVMGVGGGALARMIPAFKVRWRSVGH